MRWRQLPRPTLLVHPALVGALALLAVNDHVLKAWSGGVEGLAGTVARTATGKASDVAGVVLVALLLAVVVRSRSTVVATTAIGFAALKVVPGVAGLAAPLLGGETLRDPTDVVALAALVPVVRLLRGVDDDAHRARLRVRRALGGAIAGTLPVAVAGTSVLTITATACDLPPAVTSVTVVDGTFRAGLLAADHGTATSTDGLTWTAVDGAATTTTTAPEDVDHDAYSDPACTDDGTCYRTERDEAVQVREGDGAWRDEVRLTEAQAEALDDADRCSPQGRFAEVAVVGDVVVVPMGKEGVLRRAGDGEWARVGVVGIDPSPLPGWDGPTTPEPDRRVAAKVAQRTPFVAGLAAVALGLLAALRRGWPRGLAVAGLGGGLALTGLVVAVVVVVVPADGLRPVVVLASGLSFAASLALALWPRRSDPGLPPPPPGSPRPTPPPTDAGGQASPW